MRIFMSNKAWRTIGRIIKYTAFAVVFSVIILLVWRIASSGDPKSMKTLTGNEALASAYAENGDGLEVYYQEQGKLTRSEGNYGYFGVTQVRIIPDADQIQVVFRYNTSTLRYMEDDLGLERGTLLRDEDHFDVSLVISTDLTPERTDDNAFGEKDHPESVSEKRYFPTEKYTVKDKKNVYNYRKYVFEGVSIEDLTLAAYVDVYYKGKDANGNTVTPDYLEKPKGTLCIYDYKSENITKKLTSDDIDAIKAWLKED